MWAKILAGEANQKGSFSRRTVDILKNFNTKECELFEKLSKYAIITDNNIGIYLDDLDYSKCGGGLSYEEMLHLCHMGIVIMEKLALRIKAKSEFALSYCREAIKVHNENNDDVKIPITTITQVGFELLKIIDNKHSQDFSEELRKYLSNFIKLVN